MNSIIREKEALLTHAEVRLMFKYDPETGWLTWDTKRPNKRVRRGTRAGVVGVDGYRTVGIRKVNYPEHRLIWFYMYGVWPTGQIDHINQVRDDNRIDNLRDVDIKTNARNRGMMPTNTTGYNGVQFNKRSGKWIALIRTKTEGTLYHATFDTKEAAFEAREAKALELGFHPNHGKESSNESIKQDETN